MDGCLAFWELGCVIDWEAWGAIGSLLAVATALWLAYKNQRLGAIEQSKINKLVIYQIHFELKHIYNVASWCLDFHSSVEDGRLPENYTPAIELAITDLRKLDTPVFDTYGQIIPKFDSLLASTVITAYSTVKKNFGHISRYIDQNDLAYDQATFDSLCQYASDLQAGTSVAVSQTAKYAGLDASSALKHGPESYSDKAAFKQWV